MKLDYIIDTNILISLFNQELEQPIPNGNIGYSIITFIEILSFKGLSSGPSGQKTVIRSSLQYLFQVELNQSIAEKTIQLRQQYNLKTPDAVIVASAWESEATLITNDQQLLNLEEVKSISLSLKGNV